MENKHNVEIEKKIMALCRTDVAGIYRDYIYTIHSNNDTSMSTNLTKRMGGVCVPEKHDLCWALEDDKRITKLNKQLNNKVFYTYRLIGSSMCSLGCALRYAGINHELSTIIWQLCLEHPPTESIETIKLHCTNLIDAIIESGSKIKKKENHNE